MSGLLGFGLLAVEIVLGVAAIVLPALLVGLAATRPRRRPRPEGVVISFERATLGTPDERRRLP